MQLIRSICIVKIIVCNAFGHSLFFKLEYCFPLLFLLKGTDWCFLAFFDAMACANPFELTLNYGALCLFFVWVFVFFLFIFFYTFTSVIVISVIEDIHAGCPQNPNFFLLFCQSWIDFSVGSYLWMFLPHSYNSPLWFLYVASSFWVIAPTRST